MSTGRLPGGRAAGGLGGSFPANLAMGMTLASGWHFRDDFASPTNTTYGDRGWSLDTSGSATAAKHTMTSSDSSSFGCLLLQATTTSSSRGTLHLGLTTDRPIYSEPPVGTIFVCGVRLETSVVSRRTWLGLASVALSPDAAAANTVDFIGVVQDTGRDGGNWYGNVRSGTTDNVTSSSLAADSTGSYVHLGFERLAGGAYQFFTLTVSDTRGIERDDVGSAIDVHPTGPLTPVIGVQTLANSTKGVVIDYFEICGRTRRS